MHVVLGYSGTILIISLAKSKKGSMAANSMPSHQHLKNIYTGYILNLKVPGFSLMQEFLTHTRSCTEKPVNNNTIYFGG